MIKQYSPVRREKFDPSNDEHVASFESFMTKGMWGNVQFIAEFPFVDVPATVTNKLLKHYFEQRKCEAQV